MEIRVLLDMLQDKNDELAYATAKRIAAESESSDQYYRYIPEFVKLLDHKKSYVRIRALVLCCSQARWDDEGIIAKYLPQMLQLIHDEKPTVVRQSLNALKEVVVFRPELCETIAAELEKMDITGYKDSMTGLIQKDVDELKDLIREVDENGYENDFSDTRLHHEIYLSDARKVVSEKWKTVIRHPVKKR